MSWQDEEVTCEDEKIIRDYLKDVRGESWNELPYRFLDVDATWLDDSGFLPIPQVVQDAYARTRSDAQHYDRYERDYALWGTVPMSASLAGRPRHGELL
jgi:hypothetical protein